MSLKTNKTRDTPPPPPASVYCFECEDEVVTRRTTTRNSSCNVQCQSNVLGKLCGLSYHTYLLVGCNGFERAFSSPGNLHDRLDKQQTARFSTAVSPLTVDSRLTTACARALRWFTGPSVIEVVQSWQRALFGGVEPHGIFSSDAARYTAFQDAPQRLSRSGAQVREESNPTPYCCTAVLPSLRRRSREEHP